mmetsp:Transcript_21026/g.56594  ORF Transcript_21026/g.56594 Transcript_21026/m.56594 type:complete len:274 (+) Transcript_21026:425-1246(+)
MWPALRRPARAQNARVTRAATRVSRAFCISAHKVASTCAIAFHSAGILELTSAMRALSLGNSSKCGASRNCCDQFSGRADSTLYWLCWNSISSSGIHACSWCTMDRATTERVSDAHAASTASDRSATFLAGLPDQTWPAGTVVLGESTEPPRSTAPLPMVHPAGTMQPQPTDALSEMVEASTTLPAPTVTSLPTLTAPPGLAVTVAFSCMLLISPIITGAPCARTMAPYHTDAPAFTSTAPARVALGATKLVPTAGLLPASLTAVHGTGNFSS